jgi:predicted nucleotidyltransferase
MLWQGSEFVRFDNGCICMNVDGIQVQDAAFRSLCQRYSVKELSIFGSRARGDNRPDSDIDLLVDFLPGSRIDLIQFIELKLELQDLLGIPVDLGEKSALKPHAREQILSEARRIYAIG